MSEALAAASDSPARFADEVGQWQQQMRAALGPRWIAVPGLSRVVACSPFVAHYLARDPTRWVDLVESGDLLRADAADGYPRAIDALLAEASDEAALKQRLRRFRNREMVRIAWRDIARLADLNATLWELSALADALIDASYRWWYERLCATLGVPLGEGGERQAMVIIAMGKLGARELNFSSDVDLIFAYPEAGETRGGAITVSNQEFFIRLGQSLIKSLAEVTEDGFAFRVDMRLRPFGESGPLVASFDAMEAYYVTHGREWERYALIKARIAAGDQASGARLLAMLRPFVYRRYLDFTAIGALRDMKRLIDQEVKKKGMADNIKLGRGGIREVEFIGQVFQLVRGGRTAVLQKPAIQTVLRQLFQLGYLPGPVVAELCSAYTFLRTLENRLQQIGDQQIQSLPDTELDRARTAYGMGFESWAAFLTELTAHRERVHGHFAELLSADKSGTHRGTGAPWPGTGDVSAARQWLAGVGFIDPEAAVEVLARHAKGLAAKRLSQTERARLERVFPRVLQAAAGCSGGAALLERVLPIIETVARRSVYLVLLEEHPEALAQLIRLCAASPWIAKRIEQRPILLDELIDPRLLYNPPAPEALDAELERQVASIAPGDLEREMDVLRHFKHSQVLRVAAADVAGALQLRVVSDHLTAIAESVLHATLKLARAHLQRRSGEPCFVEKSVRRRAGFVIIAYGKLGGFELGYGSDLDLVFLHDSRGEAQMSDGAAPIHNQEYFARLAQRIIHLLTTVTPAGKVYDIDTRLRPSGNAGLLVSSLDAYRRYQDEQAWAWEHQALIRARPVAGDAGTGTAFSRLRAQVLARVRDADRLKTEVCAMRDRMRRELLRTTGGRFDLKQGPGGITDIEFMVQYLVLRSAAAYPALLQHTDNRHLLGTLADCGILSAEARDELRQAYFDYRARVHALALQEEPAWLGAEEMTGHRAKVTAIRQAVFGSTTEEEQSA